MTARKSRKRGNGEGSIYKMKDGRWRGAVSFGKERNPDGKEVWKRRIVTASTRHEADEQMDVLKKQRKHTIGGARQTVGNFLAGWLEDTVRGSVRPMTYRSYEQMARNHLVKTMPEREWKERKLDAVPGLGDVLLSKLTLQGVQRYLTSKLDADNSPSLVRYLRVVLRIALNEAVKGDLIERNVAALSKPPRVEKKEVSPFTPEQAGRFLQAASGHRLEALFTVGLAVGLRSGECSALRWPDVDLDAGKIKVRHTLQRVRHPGEKKGTLTLLPPKSDKSRRSVQLPEVCVRALRIHRERQQQERIMAGSSWKDTGHVFTSTIGTPIDGRKILKEFDALVAAATLPKQRFHDLRHACISLLHAEGVPDKAIADIVGHSDIRLTQNVYQHVYDEARRTAATKMDDLLTQVTGTPAIPVATRIATKRLIN